MAISHTDKFVFAHIPKCAGTSIEKALVVSSPLVMMDRQMLGPNNVSERGFFITGHIHANERHLAAEEFRSTMASATSLQPHSE